MRRDPAEDLEILPYRIIIHSEGMYFMAGFGFIFRQVLTSVYGHLCRVAQCTKSSAF
jgi:hypothetical protein